jgi:hypothetical protein
MGDGKRKEGGTRNEPGFSPAWVVEVESMMMTSWPLRVVICWGVVPFEVTRCAVPDVDGRRLTWGKRSSGGEARSSVRQTLFSYARPGVSPCR